MQNTARLVQDAYDQIAARYDERWSVHIRAPQQRLTRALGLGAGMRCADLGCGTGIDTIEMALLTAPEPIVAVDCSRNMLQEARARASARGLMLHPECTDAESFLRGAKAQSFDVLSLRFCLAYLDWRAIPRELFRVLRPRGRVGILTNLGTSAPQALSVYRSMVEELHVPDIALPVPLSAAELTDELARAGLQVAEVFSHAFQLRFESGAEMASWLSESGFITHPALSAAPPQVRRALWDSFAVRAERLRDDDGLQLDFELSGLVAERD